jgi:anti-sigma B factor antagonist
MTTAFTVESETIHEDRAIVAVAGEVDLYTAPQLQRVLEERLARGTAGVVVDLEETTFLDSSGLSVLIGALRSLRERDGQLVIVNRDASIARTLAITGLDRVLTVVQSRSEALELLAASSGS